MNIEHILVYKGSEYHSAFPHILGLRNGDLVCVFRQARVRQGTGIAGDANGALTHNHVDPDSRIAMVRSTDDGLTWDPDTHVVVDASDGGSDLNMAMVSELPSGELVVNNHRWFLNQTPEQVDGWGGSRLVLERPGGRFASVVFDSLYSMRSTDSGMTWSKPEPFGFPGLTFRSHTGKDGFTLMPDGSLAMPLNGYCAREQRDRVYMVRSYDGARTWVQPSTVAHDPEQNNGFGEPPMVRLPNGRLLTLMRTSNADGYLYQAHSDDGGWVWQGVKRTPIWGFPCHLLSLGGRKVLCVYGYRREPFGIRGVLSHDNGETWDISRELVIRSDGLHRDLGYPASAMLKDGRILTVYYFHDKMGHRFIAGSVFSEDHFKG